MDEKDPPTTVDGDLSETSDIVSALGASILAETIRVLEEAGFDRKVAPACLAVAVNGCLKMSGMTIVEFAEGVNAADIFWEDDGDCVVFLEKEVEDESGSAEEEPKDEMN